MTERLTNRWISIPLTEKELVEYGNQASEIHSRLAHIRFEAKESSEAFKNKISGLQEDLNEIMTKLRDKKEVRQMQCIEVVDYDKKRVNYLLEGEIVESRVLTTEELQMSIL